MLYVAIDQHAKQITICVRNIDGDTVLRRQVSTRPEKIEVFFTQLTEMDTQFMAITVKRIRSVAHHRDYARKVRGAIGKVKRTLQTNSRKKRSPINHIDLFLTTKNADNAVKDRGT